VARSDCDIEELERLLKPLQFCALVLVVALGTARVVVPDVLSAWRRLIQYDR
jgi:hypothetical protein